MARKSSTKRLEDINTTLEWYKDAGLSNDRGALFLEDMSRRIVSGKYLSKAQREWVDNLYEAGPPKTHNAARVEVIKDAADLDGMQHVKSTLRDFAFKLAKGWKLSDKQEKFLASLLSKAESIRANGRFRPEGSLREDIECAVALHEMKNDWYWQHRPGSAKAFRRVAHWLEWARRSEAMASLPEESRIDEEEPHIDQWACDKLLSSVKKPMSELKNPKFAPGAMVWKNVWNSDRVCALIAGDPVVQQGVIAYPCLIDGSIIVAPSNDLKKRRR